LGNPFVTLKNKLVQQDGKDNGRGKAHNKVQNVENQSIAQGEIKIPRLKSLLKPFKPHPGRIPHSSEEVVILKRDYDIRHGRVTEYHEKNHRQDKHHVQHPCALKVAPLPITEVPRSFYIIDHSF
jgi:hypothetical protein